MNKSLRYKCVKVPLKSILSDYETNVSKIEEAVQRTHKIVTKAYQLVRLWTLKRVKSNSWDTIEEEHFKTAFKVVRKDARKSKSILFQEFKMLFEECFKEEDKEDGNNLTNVLDNYCATEMLTAFKNNVTEHFEAYLARFVNWWWGTEEQAGSQKAWKKLRKELSPVKRDLLNGSRKSDEKYHTWIDSCIGTFVPPKSVLGHHYDLKAYPEMYFPYMVRMNEFLEDKDVSKMYQCFPQRNDLIPKSIALDTVTLIKLLVPSGKRGRPKKEATFGTNVPTKRFYLSNVSNTQRQLWDKYFNIRIRVTNYCFDYSIQTDGMSASIRFIHHEDLAKQIEKKERLRKGRAKVKGLSQKERSRIASEKRSRKKQQKRSRPKKKKSNGKKKKKDNNIIYLDDEYLDVLSQKCQENSFIVIDPGKRDLFTAMNKEGKLISYSFRRHLKETKRLKYQRIIQNHRQRLGILELEEPLSKLNGKTVDPEQFKDYIKSRTGINKQLLPLYADLKFRQYCWYGYLERRRADDNMINRVKKAFGSNVIVFYGDWSVRSQMKFFAPTPNKKIKRKFAGNFQVYDLDEYHTSKLYWKTEEEGKNLKLKDKDGKLRKKHAIKTFTVHNRMECINRDRNACLNMRKLVLHYLATGQWLSSYRVKKSRDINPLKRVKTRTKASSDITPFEVHSETF